MSLPHLLYLRKQLILGANITVYSFFSFILFIISLLMGLVLKCWTSVGVSGRSLAAGGDEFLGGFEQDHRKTLFQSIETEHLL